MPGERIVKYKKIDRNQLGWQTLDVENLIPADHTARVIWDLCGRMNLSKFESEAKSLQGEGGRPCWGPQLLVSVWVYGYTLGIASARALERMMGWEPGLRWLCALEEINHHTLSDFRVEHGRAVEELFAQQLALLEQEGLLDLRTLMQDGTKIAAQAGKESYRRRARIEERLTAAKQAMKELDRQAAAEERVEERRQAAQQRARRERVERMEAALQEMEQRQARASEKEREQVRVSLSEPEARKMRHNDGGWKLSYNVQTTTSAGAGSFLVGVHASNAENDLKAWPEALQQVEENTGQAVQRLVADAGYVSRDNVQAMAERGIELVAPWKSEQSREAGALRLAGIAPEYGGSQFQKLGEPDALLCPENKLLENVGSKKHHGRIVKQYRAKKEDCLACAARTRCCGHRNQARQVERSEESEPVQSLVRRMSEPAMEALYKRRKQVAEWPHLWIKSLRGFRRFSVRGLKKVGLELLWAALAYNVEQMIRVKRTKIA